LKRYKLIIAYDGTDYNGWQQQPNAPTIEDTLKKRFYAAFQTPVKILGASRTDSGVHALGQVASCTTELDIEPEKLRKAWNNVLPPSIVIRKLTDVPEDFHPHKDVGYKIYYYHFFLQRPLPFVQRYGTYLWKQIDLEKLEKILQVFVGTHDFRSFCTGDDMGNNTVRTIESANIEYLDNFKAYRIAIKGPSFLRYMIRRIVGACFEVASKEDMSIDVLQKALAEKDPCQLLPTSPAKGLLMYTIKYKGEIEDNEKFIF